MIIDNHPSLRYRRILPSVLPSTEEPSVEEPRKKRKVAVVACDICREKKTAVSRKSADRLDDVGRGFRFRNKIRCIYSATGNDHVWPAGVQAEDAIIRHHEATRPRQCSNCARCPTMKQLNCFTLFAHLQASSYRRLYRQIIRQRAIASSSNC